MITKKTTAACYILFIGAMLVAVSSHAQSRTVFLELGGSGGLGSFNFERWMPPALVKTGTPFEMENEPKPWWYGMRYGLGFSPIDRNNGWVVVAPIMYTVMYKKHRNPHAFELSGGVAPSVTTKGAIFIKSPFALGYRYHRGKLFFRVAYTPLFAWLVDFQWQHWAGISIGYQIEKKQ